MEADLQGQQTIDDWDLSISDLYKSLQLLEFLIKNGSERVIDDARSHLSLLKMLKQFHFIDQNGKDQGVNVRNRSKELAELLGDVDRIRAERKKARANRNKFGGVEGGAMSGGMSSGSRYGGFGSEDAGGYGSSSSGVYGDGGGFGGNSSGFQDSSRRSDRFDEDDEYDGGAVTSAQRRTATIATEPVRAKKPEPAKPKEPEIDILAFDDDIPPETPPKEFSSNGGRVPSNVLDNDEDDFDDFQTASPINPAPSKPSIPGFTQPLATGSAFGTQIAAPQPVAPSQGHNLNDIFSTISPAPSTASGMVSPPAPNYNISSPPAPSAFQSPAPLPQQNQPQRAQPTEYQAAAPNYFTSVQAPASTSQPLSTPGARPSMATSSSFSKPPSKSSASGGDAFASLWSTTSAGAGIKKTPTPGSSGPKLADMQKQKAAAGIWGAPATGSTMAPIQHSMQSNGQRSGGGGALDDLLG